MKNYIIMLLLCTCSMSTLLAQSNKEKALELDNKFAKMWIFDLKETREYAGGSEKISSDNQNELKQMRGQIINIKKDGTVFYYSSDNKPVIKKHKIISVSIDEVILKDEGDKNSGITLSFAKDQLKLNTLDFSAEMKKRELSFIYKDTNKLCLSDYFALLTKFEKEEGAYLLNVIEVTSESMSASLPDIDSAIKK